MDPASLGFREGKLLSIIGMKIKRWDSLLFGANFYDDDVDDVDDDDDDDGGIHCFVFGCSFCSQQIEVRPISFLLV